MRIYHGPRTTECFDNSHFVKIICALHRNRGQHVVGGDLWAETAFTYANSEWQDSAQIQAKCSTGRRLEPRDPLASSREFRWCGTRRSCRRELEMVMVDRTVLWPEMLLPTSRLCFRVELQQVPARLVVESGAAFLRCELPLYVTLVPSQPLRDACAFATTSAAACLPDAMRRSYGRSRHTIPIKNPHTSQTNNALAEITGTIKRPPFELAERFGSGSCGLQHRDSSRKDRAPCPIWHGIPATCNPQIVGMKRGCATLRGELHEYDLKAGG
jgi:hypothetical protein